MSGVDVADDPPVDEPPAPTWRQRYECTCGFHGWREADFPPTHIRCSRCSDVAVACDAAELVT